MYGTDYLFLQSFTPESNVILMPLLSLTTPAETFRAKGQSIREKRSEASAFLFEMEPDDSYGIVILIRGSKPTIGHLEQVSFPWYFRRNWY